MAFKDIEEKLKNRLTVKVSFPTGTIWLPDSHLSIDDWLTSIAETDEELKELNIPRIRFLQNRWPIEKLVELEWGDQFSNRRVIMAMNVGSQAYILFSDWSEYQVIAAIEPKDRPLLYRALVSKLLDNPNFVPIRPDRVRNLRPDLVPDWVPAASTPEFQEEGTRLGAALKPAERWKSFVSDVLEGWIQKWLNVPETVWHEDTPASISKTQPPTERKRAS